MEIVVVAPSTLPVPPFHGYGGRQRGIHDFCNHFARRGHRVHLVAPGDSDVGGLEGVTLHPTIEHATAGPNAAPGSDRRQEAARHCRLALETVLDLLRSRPIDVVNSRYSSDGFNRALHAAGVTVPVVFHLHEANNDPEAFLESFNSLGSNFHAVAHGPSHMQQFAGVKRLAYVLYGIDPSMFCYSPSILTQSREEPVLDVQEDMKRRGKDYYITIGRIHPSKGQKTAIDLVLEETEDDIVIAGTTQSYYTFKFEKEGTSDAYFEDEMLPRRGERVHFFGNADEGQKRELLRHAKGFIFPTGFECREFREPFARAPLEALASGVPVLAFHYASTPEMIEDGVNGVLFDDLAGARAGIRRLATIDRAECRKSVEEKFHAARVARDYEALLLRILAGDAARAPAPRVGCALGTGGGRP